MKTSKHIAKHLREIYFGGNWTCSSLKTQLSDVSLLEAKQIVYNLNSILTLTHHIHYYILAVTQVLKGHKLIAKDELSFNHPSIESEQQWNTYLENIWKEAEVFADLIEQLPDAILETNFTDEKYGIYYRNLQGIIEHSHYHLGQISLLKKIIKSKN